MLRTTIRFNDVEELELKEVQRMIHEEDISKVVKFALHWTKHHIGYVTQAMVGDEWEITFHHKTKSRPMDRKVY